MKNSIIILIVVFIFSHGIYSQMQPPVLLYPVNGAINIPTTTFFDWIGVAGAQKYRIQLSTNSGFILPLTIDTVIITGYQAPPGCLAYLTQYFWRVNAINNNDTSAWSAVWNFTTMQAAPAAPVLIAPPNGSTGISLTPLLDWNDVPAAQTYRIQLSTNSGFSSAVFDSLVIPSSVIIPSGRLLNNTLYNWHVNASNAGGTSPWSLVWTFTTTIVGTGNISTGIPKDFKLYQNYPNPFNPSTLIKFDVPHYAFTIITVYNILGQEKEKIVNEFLNPGRYEIRFIPENYSSCVYYLRMQAEDYFEMKKIVLIK